MKHFGIDEVRDMIKDVRNTEEKKSMYIILGALAAVAVGAMAIAAIVIKNHCCTFDEYDYYDDWDSDYETNDEIKDEKQDD